MQELIDQYLAGPVVLRDATVGLTPSQLAAHPIPSKWSIAEVVCHLADFEIVYADRIKRVLAEEKPALLSGDPDRFAADLIYDKRNIAEELSLIEAIRRHLAVILQNCSASKFQRVGLHSQDGELTLETLLQRVTAHIPHHVPFIVEKRRAMGL